MYSRKTMKSALETMMFMCGEPLEVKDAASVLEADRGEVRELFRELMNEYEQEGRGIRIREADDAFGFVTHIENDIFVRKLCTPVRIRRLSQAALEVLAIIAYRQPVTRSEIDSIRGIKSERVIDGLIDKGLIEISGRSEGVGRPLIYVTTREFLKKFGFSSLDDLPEVPEYEELRRQPEEDAGYGQLRIDFEGDSKMRINQYIAAAGITSRRKADEMIEEGRVRINGAVLMSQGYHVQEGDIVEVDGVRIVPEQKKVYYLLNKPAGYVTSTADKEGRPVVTELVPDSIRVFPVGRLDLNTTGLLILTNDGDLSNKLMHPSHGFNKKYLVRAAGIVTLKEAERLRRGIDIGGFVTSPADVDLIRHDRNSTVVEITIHEGKNRQVRRMFKAIGHPVLELSRIELGNLTIGRLAQGQCRKLSPAEVEYLKRI